MKFLSICSGIEAASVASAPMGWKAVGFSEIEPFQCAVLKHHYPDVPNYGDMTKFEEWPDMDIDLLCGGTPCQAFSVAGQRKGLADARGNLSLTFCRIADRYNPEWIMWENVPGVLSSKDNAFGCFLAELCGADAAIKPVGGRWPNAGVVAGPKRTAAWRVLDAQYVRVDGYPHAVPQRRRRVFVVACPGTTGDPATVLFEPEGLHRHTPPRREKGQGASADVVPSLVASGRGVERAGETRGQDPVVAIPEVCGCLSDGAHNGGGLNGQVSCAEVAPCMTSGGAPFERTGNERVECEAIVATTQYGEQAGTLTARYDSSPCSDRGQNVVVVHGTQDPCTSKETAFALGRNNGGENAILDCSENDSLRFHCNSCGKRFGVNDEPDFDDAGNAINCVQCPKCGERRLDKIYDHLDDWRGEQLEAIAFNGDQSAKTRSMGEKKECTPTLRADGPCHVAKAMQVRRLTPVECERLQGFPDNYTRIPWRNKPAEDCQDGPRYKALGNSWAVNCARWVFRRIEMGASCN